MDELFESMQPPKPPKKGVDRFIEDVERDCRALLMASKSLPAASTMVGGVGKDGVVEDDEPTLAPLPTPSFSNPQNEDEEKRNRYLERITLLARQKELEAKLRKTTNVRNHKLTRINAERAERRKTIRKEIDEIKARLAIL
jgi:hypothetical protein